MAAPDPTVGIPTSAPPGADPFDGPGEMRERCRAHDWAATPLGPVAAWPAALRAAVRLCLDCARPMAVFGGPALVCLYNDAYAAAVGAARHPHALGRPAREVWADLWEHIGPEYVRVMADGVPVVRDQDLHYVVDRGRGPEETYWTYATSPVRDDGGRVVGCHTLITETTARARAEAALREREARQAFLLRVSDALRPLADPAEIVGAATRLLGESVGASRAYYAEWPPGTDAVEIRRDYAAPGLPSLVGRYPIEHFRSTDARFREGRTWVVEDAADGTIPAAERDYCLAHGVAAWVDVPLVKGGALQAALFLVQDAPRRWSATEIVLAEETAERTWAAVERARAEAAVRASEEKYRALFTEMDEAYAVVDVLADGGGVGQDGTTGRWTDFRFVEVNPAFIRHTGMPYPVGRTATELLGTPNPRWAELYGRAAETGESIRVDESELTLGRVFDLNIFRLGGAGSRRVAVLFTDVTDRRRAEAALAASAARQAYLVRLGDALRPLHDPAAIQTAAARALGEHLGATRVLYAEVEGHPAPRWARSGGGTWPPGTPR